MENNNTENTNIQAEAQATPEVDSSNIFDEFESDSNLVDEVNKIKEDRDRDMFYYLTKGWQVLQVMFWAGLISTLLAFTYVSIQTNPEFRDSSVLDPFCFVFLWDLQTTSDASFCSSVAALKQTHETKLTNLKQKQANDILPVLERIYEVENFTKTKEVLFLVDKTKNKLRVLDILREFDNLKTEYDKVDKQKIQCNGISINAQENVISMKCSAYSAWYERGLRGLDGTLQTPLKWTSVSIANSFLNYIDKTSEVFTVVDRQKMFKSENTLGEKSDFTNKTDFALKLQYNLK